MISQGDEEFNGADDEFEAARAEDNAFNAERVEDSAERARSQRVGNLDGHVTGTTNERKEDKSEGNAAGNCTQLARNPVGGGHGWVNKSALTSAP